jgi:hypothetical protein
MDQHRINAERIADAGRMLAAGRTERGEAVARDVVPALDRDALDRICHVLDGDADGAVGHSLG